MARLAVIVVGGWLIIMALAAANASRDLETVTVDWRVIRRPPLKVITETPKRGLIVQTVSAPGVVLPARHVQIGSQLIGRVVSVEVKDSDHVKKGDLLIKLDDTDARARLDSSTAKIARLKAAIDHSTADVKKAGRDVENNGRLVNRGATSRIELADAWSAREKAEATLEMSRFELAEAEALRRVNQQEIDRTEIRAPIAGVVSGLNAEAGEIIIAGTTNLPGSVLMTISDDTAMMVRADVDETDLPLVRLGQTVRIFPQADSSTPIDGVVAQISPWGKKSEEGVSFETTVQLRSSSRVLRSQMTATVEFEVHRAPDALGVPVQAVIQCRVKDLPDTVAVRRWFQYETREAAPSPGDDEQYLRIVYVVEDGVAHARPIEVGRSDEHRVEILRGIEPSDWVVVGPFRALDELRDGASVVPTDADKLWENGP